MADPAQKSTSTSGLYLARQAVEKRRNRKNTSSGTSGVPPNLNADVISSEKALCKYVSAADEPVSTGMSQASQSKSRRRKDRSKQNEKTIILTEIEKIDINKTPLEIVVSEAENKSAIFSTNKAVVSEGDTCMLSISPPNNSKERQSKKEPINNKGVSKLNSTSDVNHLTSPVPLLNPSRRNSHKKNQTGTASSLKSGDNTSNQGQQDRSSVEISRQSKKLQVVNAGIANLKLSESAQVTSTSPVIKETQVQHNSAGTQLKAVLKISSGAGNNHPVFVNNNDVILPLPPPKRDPNAGLLRLSEESLSAAMRAQSKNGFIKESPATFPINVPFNTTSKPVDATLKSIDPLPTPILSLIDTFQNRFSRVEKHAQALVDKTKKDKNKMQDLCLLGLSVGAPELNAAIIELQGVTYSTYEFILIRDNFSHLNFTVFCGMIQKIWSVLRAIIELFSVILDKYQAASHESLPNRAQIQQVFISEIEEMAFWIGSQLHAFEIKFDLFIPIRSVDLECLLEGHQNNIQTLYSATLQVLFTALGDMIRYKEAYRSDLSVPSNYHLAEAYYRHAYSVSIPTGFIRKKLISMSKKHGTAELNMAFQMFLCLTAKEHPYNCRELLLDLLERQRSTCRQLAEVDALSQLTVEEQRDRFRTHLLSSICIAFCRTGADTFLYHLERMKRHFAALLQICAVDAFKNSIYSQNKGQASPRTMIDTIDTNKLNALEDIITASVYSILAVAHLISEKNNVASMMLFKSAYMVSVQKSGVSIDNVFTQKLNQIRSTPGLLDIIKLILSFVSCLVGGTGIGMYASTQDESSGLRDIFRFRVTLHAVSLFLDFISENPVFQFLPLLDPAGWDQFETGLKSYFGVLQYAIKASRLSATETSKQMNANTILVEDEMLRGVSPLYKCIERRFLKRPNSSFDSFTVTTPDASTRYLEFSDYLRTKCRVATSDALVVRYLRCKERTNYLSSVFINLPIISEDISDPKFDDPVCVMFDSNMKPLLHHLSDAANVDGAKKIFSSDVMLARDTKPAAISIAAAPRISYQLPGFGSKLPVTASAASVSHVDFANPEPEGDACYTHINGSSSCISVRDQCETRDQDDLLLTLLTQTHDLESNSIAAESTENKCKLIATEVNGNSTEGKGFAGVLHLNSENFNAAMVAVQNASTTTGEHDNVKDDKKLQKRLKHSEKKKASEELYLSMFSKRLPIGPSMEVSSRSHTTVALPSKLPSTVVHLEAKNLPMLVLDTPNIAMRHGLNGSFSCRGIALVFDFFLHMGHKVIGFLPDYYFDMKRVGELKRAANAGVKSMRAAQLPDDINILQQLAAAGYLVGTPSQDYDDSYCIGYAKSHNAYIVTNDMYRDHLATIKDGKIRQATREWLQSHCISYTFVQDEFVPNQDAKFST